MTCTLFKGVPLKDLDPASLALAIEAEAAQLPTLDEGAVKEALTTAAFLHRNQTRANRKGLTRTPYIEHPLRNALRVLRWGVTDLDIVLACILHDTVEDCVEEMLTEFILRDPATLSPAEQRDLALDWIDRQFGPGTARLVGAVTNPLPTGEILSKAAKRERYALHILEAVTDDPKVFLVKFSDYMDNAAGLYHNAVDGNEAMVAHLAAKYLPVVDIFSAEFEANGAGIRALVSAAGFEEIGLKLRTSRERLRGLVAEYA